MTDRIQNRLSSVRRRRGVGATELARLAGVSRQTIHAIEAGSYVPNTGVALRMARALEVPVEELFALEAEAAETPGALRSELLSAIPAAKGQPVRVCQVGPLTVSIPVSASPYYLPEADGVIARGGRAADKAELRLFSKDGVAGKQLVLAGCDPAIGLIAPMAERLGGVEIVPAAASSRLALGWLKQGKVHVAGSHLKDSRTGEYNLPFIRHEMAGEEFTVITFAQWEEGFVIAPGNPKGIRAATALARRSVKFINREIGSGSRGLLDRLLTDAGIPARRIAGYDRIAFGHLAAAYAVLGGEADCCVATQSAARAFGLDFVPLCSERYDFVLRRSMLETPAMQAFLDVLQRAALRRTLETVAGYETGRTGSVIA